MKKYLILLLAAAAALVSCGKEILDPEDGDVTVQTAPITFNLTANHPDATKAVKTGWESGDAIFVFFTGAEAPRHLKMTYDGTNWTSAEYNGATQTDGALGLKNGDSGTMRAVFLPFGSDATVSAAGTHFMFSEDYYTYYATATLPYTVTDNTVSGAFSMQIPEGYVQFFVEDAEATDGAYTLATDAVMPCYATGVADDGSIAEIGGWPGDPMPGYAYNGGYLFSGKLDDSYTSIRYEGVTAIENDAYYFAKTKVADNSRADYFVTGKTLASHSAVKLPANNNVYAVKYGDPNTGKWVPVGEGTTVPFFDIEGTPPTESATPLGTWYTCNYGCTAPEQLGSLYTFYEANSLGVTLPTKAQFEMINNSGNCSHTWLTVHGQQGVVIKADRGFLFLPAQNSSRGYYWSSTEFDFNEAWNFCFSSVGGHSMFRGDRTDEYAVRPFVN